MKRKEYIDSLLNGTLPEEERQHLGAAIESAGRVRRDHKQAWENVVEEAEIPVKRGFARYSRKFEVVAAMLLPVFLIGVLFTLINKSANSGYTHYAAVGDVCDTLSLDDGSLIILHPGSSVDYRLRPNKRSVRLAGLAHFKVDRQEGRPFLVHANHSTVRVLGTEFTVENLEGRDRVHVAVNSGRVAFSAYKRWVFLKGGESATMIDKKIKKDAEGETVDPFAKELVLENVDMAGAARMLLSYYPEIRGIRGEATDTVRVTTIINSQSADEAINELNLHFSEKFLLDRDGYLEISH